jgi:hypothetical protein
LIGCGPNSENRMAEGGEGDERGHCIVEHAIERAIKAEALARELVAALRRISEILDNATCRCRCGFCEYFNAQKRADKALAKAKEVLGDELPSCGRGNTKKDEVRLAVFKRWSFEAKTNDEIDAYVLARIGLAYLGYDDDLTKPQREVVEALGKVV